MAKLIERLLEYVWITDDHGIIEGDRPQVGRVRMMHNPEQMERILIEAKQYSSRPCLLCGHRATRYAKTKGGFQQVCDNCREILNKNDLLEAENVVYPMVSHAD